MSGRAVLLASGVGGARLAGFSTVIVRMPAPFDRETIDWLPEVLALLGD